jgi:membrane protein required for colicin V production
MAIDLLFVLLMAAGILRGLFKGLILAVFTTLAYILGLAVAMKFSYLASEGLRTLFHMASRWTPLVAFLLVFAGVILLVRWVALLLQKALEGLTLGWLNRLGGAVFYCVLYGTIYSILLYYLVKMHLIGGETLKHSVAYPYIAQIAPEIMGGLGRIVPWFRGIFENPLF